METVRINGLTLCHKGSSGRTVSTVPDICRSPGSPVPYVNVAFARDLDNGPVTVMSHGGKMCGVRGSRFACSTGDEPGRGRGVISNTVEDEATWLSWSANVYIENRPATRLSDRMLMNRGNAASLGGYQTSPIGGGESAHDLMCRLGCECYARLRPRNPVTQGLSAAADIVSPGDEDNAPGRYQRCFEAGVRALYPDTVLGPTIVGENFVNNGYLPEVGFWDPTNPANTWPAKPPGEVILQGEPHDIPQQPRRAPWGGYKWFNVRGSRWMDLVRVQGGQMTEMYDMKFPGDRANTPDKDRAYRAIARQHRASYDEFWVLEECDDCTAQVEDYEAERARQADKLLRDLTEGTRKALEQMPLPLPGGGRLPRPVFR